MVDVFDILADTPAWVPAKRAPAVKAPARPVPAPARQVPAPAKKAPAPATKVARKFTPSEQARIDFNMALLRNQRAGADVHDAARATLTKIGVDIERGLKIRQDRENAAGHELNRQNRLTQGWTS
jgi:hypothetical protein